MRVQSRGPVLLALSLGLLACIAVALFPAAAPMAATLTAADAPRPLSYFPERGGCTNSGLTEIPDWSPTVTTRADVDGDGAEDKIIGYRIGPLPIHEPRVRVELARGIVRDAKGTLVIDRFVGHTDLDGDGRDEVWYRPLTSARDDFAMLVFHDCEISDVSDGPHEVPFIGHAGFPGGGVECRDDGLIVQTELSADGWNVRALRLNGTRVYEASRLAGSDLKTLPDGFRWRGFHCPVT